MSPDKMKLSLNASDWTNVFLGALPATYRLDNRENKTKILYRLNAGQNSGEIEGANFVDVNSTHIQARASAGGMVLNIQRLD